jgi:hypothetical protein
MVQMRYFDRARLLSGGERLGYKPGNVVSFEEKYIERYSIFGKEYFLIKERRVNGLWAA